MKEWEWVRWGATERVLQATENHKKQQRAHVDNHQQWGSVGGDDEAGGGGKTQVTVPVLPRGAVGLAFSWITWLKCG